MHPVVLVELPTPEGIPHFHKHQDAPQEEQHFIGAPPPLWVSFETLLAEKPELTADKAALPDDVLQVQFVPHDHSQAVDIEGRVGVVVVRAQPVLNRSTLAHCLPVRQEVPLCRSQLIVN